MNPNTKSYVKEDPTIPLVIHYLPHANYASKAGEPDMKTDPVEKNSLDRVMITHQTEDNLEGEISGPACCQVGKQY